MSQLNGYPRGAGLDFWKKKRVSIDNANLSILYEVLGKPRLHPATGFYYLRHHTANHNVSKSTSYGLYLAEHTFLHTYYLYHELLDTSSRSPLEPWG